MKPTTILLSALALLWAGSALDAQQGFSADAKPTISVTGESIVYVKPDKILISLGIETSDMDIQRSKNKNNEILSKSLAAFKELGVTDDNIQTDNIEIEPRWDSRYDRKTFLGYFVTNRLIITIDDPTKTESVVTAALVNGVNYIYDIDFQTTQLKQYREQARDLALKAAKEKAEKMAAVLDQQIGPPVSITENPTYSYYYSPRGRDAYAMSQNAVMNYGSGEIVDNIALGKVAVRATVSVTFTIKPDDSATRIHLAPGNGPISPSDAP